tara:strand:+ start:1997 stop:2431 length:435 start_codon:yes stop_codon:yes gene_type:complete
MSYENSYSVSILETPTEQKTVNECPTCNTRYGEDVPFCSQDGTKLQSKLVDVEVVDIIKEFKEFTEDGYLIKDNGEPEMTGSGGNIEGNLLEFSKKYPNGVFQIYGIPDNGFGEPDYKKYYKNGKQNHVNATYVFEPYDESKLK